MSGRLMYLPITDYQMNKKGRSLKFISTNALLVILGKSSDKCKIKEELDDEEFERDLMFPRVNDDIEQAVLILLKEKHNRFTVCRVSVVIFYLYLHFY